MTPERIKEIDAQPRGGYEISLNDMRAIIEAAHGQLFLTVGYAYAYGFLRGQRAEKAKRRKKKRG